MKATKILVLLPVLVGLFTTTTIAQAVVSWKSIFQKPIDPTNNHITFEHESLDSLTNLWYRSASVLGSIDIDPGISKVFISGGTVENNPYPEDGENIGLPVMTAYDMYTGKLMYRAPFKLFQNSTSFVQIDDIKASAKLTNAGVYAAGRFCGKFGVTNTVFASKYSADKQPDIFILKFNKNLTAVKGITIHSQSAMSGGSDGYYASSVNIDVDKNGNVVSLIDFKVSSSAKFDFDPGSAVAAIPVDYQDKVVAVYDKDLKYKNAFKIDAHTNPLEITGMNVDENSNVYICGSYSKSGTSAIDFDPSAAVYNLPAPTDDENLFLAKYSSIGKLLWAKSFPIVNYNNYFSSKATKNGVYLVTHLEEGESIDVDPSGATKNYFGNGIVIAKYSPANGALVWSLIDTLAGNNGINTIEADINNNLYIVSADKIFSTAETSLYLSKYSANGVKKWSNRVKRPPFSSGVIGEYGSSETSINVRKNEIYLSGNFKGKYYLLNNNTQLISNTSPPNKVTNFMCKYILSGSALLPEYNTEDDNAMAYKTGFEGTKVDTLQVILYPNPVEDLLNIQLKTKIENVCIVKILNLSGQIIKEFSVSDSQNFNVKTADLEQGIYLLNINSGNVFVQKKFVKVNE